jgi:hypothetical protein
MAVAVAIETRNIETAFAGISGVERVYLDGDAGLMEVMTIIDSDDNEDLYSQIYQREKALIHEFPAVNFNFHVIARRGRPVEEVVGFDAPTWEKDTSTSCRNATNI